MTTLINNSKEAITVTLITKKYGVITVIVGDKPVVINQD